MFLSVITADLIHLGHTIGMSIIGTMPVLPFLVEVATHKKKKHNRKLYIGLGIINSGILLSYYFNNNYCLLSQFENYFNPSKYESYQVDKQTLNSLYSSNICLGIQILFDKFEIRAIAVGGYYLSLIYNFFNTK